MTAPSLGAGSAGDALPLLTDDEVAAFRSIFATSHPSALWLNVRQQIRRTIAAHVARASTAGRERVARVEALADEWEAPPGSTALGSHRQSLAYRLRAALAAPHVERERVAGRVVRRDDAGHPVDIEWIHPDDLVWRVPTPAAPHVEREAGT